MRHPTLLWGDRIFICVALPSQAQISVVVDLEIYLCINNSFVCEGHAVNICESTIPSAGGVLMLKIVYPICCGIDVHKTFVIANIATTDEVSFSIFISQQYFRTVAR